MNSVKTIYPTCYRSFIKMVGLSERILMVYSNLREKPRPFDVSLRDGLQTLCKLDQDLICKNNAKENIFSDIITKHNPRHIEIGSLCSDKVFPVFKDSISLYNKLSTTTAFYKGLNLFLLVANEKQLYKLEENNICPNLSFITSISDSFQMKNTKMDVKTSIQGITNMLYTLDDSHRKCMPLVKLYVSCINECPIDGKLSTEQVVSRLMPMFQLGADKIFLSDTCGTLTCDDFDVIMRKLIVRNISPQKIGLHLHVRNENVIEDIISRALDYGVMDFDVSDLAGGGCSVTMDKTKLAPNLSYDLYYRSLMKWLIKKVDL
jgi:isopropylmalate/homocitrate/citramalate synthase